MPYFPEIYKILCRHLFARGLGRGSNSSIHSENDFENPKSVARPLGRQEKGRLRRKHFTAP